MAPTRWDRRLLWTLGLAALVRLVFFLLFWDLELRSDELQYQEIAVNLAQGRGFAMDGRLTSWRPPFYPFVLSVLYRVAGTTDPVLIRAFQLLLSLGTIVLVYLLGRRLFDRNVAVAAALLVGLYPTLLFYNNHLLTEVLFIFLCLLTAYLFLVYLQTLRLAVLLLAGFALGLSVLTREIVWPTVAIMILLACFASRVSWRQWVLHSAALLAVLVIVLTPWVVRNTRVQGTFTFIATNGGMVFLAGHYEHTPPDRPWRAHALDPALKVRYLFPKDLSEGVRQKLAVRRALAFIKANPALTVRNSLVRAANVWGLEREVIGTFLNGVYGDAGRLLLLSLTATIFAAYVVTTVGGITGLSFALARGAPGAGFHAYVAALAAFLTLAHAAASGHPRYHLQLIPLLAIYAAYAWRLRRTVWAERRSAPFVAASACAGLLSIVWIREVLFVEFERFARAMNLN